MWTVTPPKGRTGDEKCLAWSDAGWIDWKDGIVVGMNVPREAWQEIIDCLLPVASPQGAEGMNDPIIKTADTERLRRITYTQNEQALDICENKKTGRVVVHTYRPGQVPAVVTFGNIDQLWYLLETLYTLGTNVFVPLPDSITKTAETAPEAPEMHYADHGVAGGLPHSAETCTGTYWGVAPATDEYGGPVWSSSK